MLIVYFWGGLGNQMFQYSFYRELLSRGYDVKADLSYFDDWELPHGSGDYQLKRIFDINPEVASPDEIKKLVGSATSKNKMIRLISRKLKVSMSSYIYKSDAGYDVDDDIFHKISSGKDYFLQGYWQNEDWFPNVKNDIRTAFTFPRLNDDHNQQLIQSIRENHKNKTYTIGMHVRRYSKEVNSSGSSDLDFDYYEKALREGKKLFPDAKILVFSNDIEWCKDNFSSYDLDIVDWNQKPEHQYIDMQLMSFCDCNILCPSSYSFWGGWLDPDNKNKIRIGPKNWFGHGCPMPKDWLRLETGKN